MYVCLNRLSLGVFERNLAFRFNLIEQVASDIIITYMG